MCTFEPQGEGETSHARAVILKKVISNALPPRQLFVIKDTRVFSLRCRTRCSARRQSARTRAASACAAHRPPLSCPHSSQPQRGAAPGHQLRGKSTSRTHVNRPYTCQQAVHMSTSYYTRTDTMSRGAGGGHISRFASGALAASEDAHRAGWGSWYLSTEAARCSRRLQG